MTIDWASLVLVAITTVVAAVGIALLLVLYGLYLIIPQFH